MPGFFQAWILYLEKFTENFVLIFFLISNLFV